MQKSFGVIAMIGIICALATTFALPTGAQSRSELARLYILNCGEGVAGDISRWSPGVNVGMPMEFVDNCYLIRHSQGWLLWDTGVADAIASMPDGQRPIDPRAIHWKRPKTLASQLSELGVSPSNIKFVAISHAHPDHIGNIGLFSLSTLLVQKSEYESPTPFGQALRAVTSTVKLLEGDYDVFGDGSVTIVATPGHTPGHQSLLVKLPKTGAILLSGDAVHFKSNWENRGLPSINFNGEQTASSMQHMAEIMVKEHAQLWINHDKAQRDSLNVSPSFYD